MTSIKEGYVLDCVSGQEVKATPEEIQAVQPFAMKLMEDYGYPKSHIQTRPQWHVKVRPSDVKKEYPVDIAVFTSENHDDNSLFMIVECKKKTRKDGRTQLEDYILQQGDVALHLGIGQVGILLFLDRSLGDDGHAQLAQFHHGLECLSANLAGFLGELLGDGNGVGGKVDFVILHSKFLTFISLKVVSLSTL